MRSRILVGLVALLPMLAWAAPRQHASIRAYINVSSGCQAETVDFLNGLKSKYAPSVALEIIDFGDRGKGLKRWQDSGYRCMTIEVNGWVLVKFPHGGKTKAVAFQMPQGFNWKHADLEQAVQAALQGQLGLATAAEVEASAPPRQVKATIAASQATANGRQLATVTVNGTIALYIPGVPAEAGKRAKAAALALRTWLAKPVKLSQLAVKQGTGGWKVLANGKTVITATAADGKVFQQTPQAVAQMWANGLKHALVLASQ